MIDNCSSYRHFRPAVLQLLVAGMWKTLVPHELFVH
jgi:hypothetical protein